MPQYIVWNEARNEAVVFLEECDALTAVTGEKHDFHGYPAQSAVAADFYETYGEDENLKVEPLFDLIAHLARQRAFSLMTFGPGPRTKGVVDHIRKELAEIEAKPDDIEEWVDLILLALDGAWRAGFEPQQIVEGIDAKQAKNEARDWPDWRTADPDKAIEHVRTAEPPRGRSDLVIPDTLVRIIADALGVEPGRVTADAKLAEDLGADSLDAVEIVTNVEFELGIVIHDTEAEAIATVGDLASIVQMKA